MSNFKKFTKEEIAALNRLKELHEQLQFPSSGLDDEQAEYDNLVMRFKNNLPLDDF